MGFQVEICNYNMGKLFKKTPLWRPKKEMLQQMKVFGVLSRLHPPNQIYVHHSFRGVTYHKQADVFSPSLCKHVCHRAHKCSHVPVIPVISSSVVFRCLSSPWELTSFCQGILWLFPQIFIFPFFCFQTANTFQRSTEKQKYTTCNVL